MRFGIRSASATLAIVSLLGSVSVHTQGGLKIVVISGEDAVNIIQQKTAVAPVVEVRDRNDLPVPAPISSTLPVPDLRNDSVGKAVGLAMRCTTRNAAIDQTAKAPAAN